MAAARIAIRFSVSNFIRRLILGVQLRTASITHPNRKLREIISHRSSCRGASRYAMFFHMDIAEIRKEYTFAGLRRADLHPDPIQQFKNWFQAAISAGVAEPNAM